MSLLCNVSMECTYCHYMVHMVLRYGKYSVTDYYGEHSVTDYYGEHSILYDEHSVTIVILCTRYSDMVYTV